MYKRGRSGDAKDGTSSSKLKFEDNDEVEFTLDLNDGTGKGVVSCKIKGTEAVLADDIEPGQYHPALFCYGSGISGELLSIELEGQTGKDLESMAAAEIAAGGDSTSSSGKLDDGPFKESLATKLDTKWSDKTTKGSVAIEGDG